MSDHLGRDMRAGTYNFGQRRGARDKAAGYAKFDHGVRSRERCHTRGATVIEAHHLAAPRHDFEAEQPTGVFAAGGRPHLFGGAGKPREGLDVALTLGQDRLDPGAGQGLHA